MSAIDLTILRLDEDNYDPELIAPLLKSSLAEGYNLVLRLVENWESGENRFNKPGEALFAAKHEGRILGVGGRSLDPYLDDNKAVRVRHVYVLPDWRGLGVGAALMEKILDVPPGLFTRATLRSLNPVARKFYARLGFEAVDDNPVVTHQMKIEEK